MYNNYRYYTVRGKLEIFWGRRGVFKRFLRKKSIFLPFPFSFFLIYLYSIYLCGEVTVRSP